MKIEISVREHALISEMEGDSCFHHTVIKNQLDMDDF